MNDEELLVTSVNVKDFMDSELIVDMRLMSREDLV